MKLLIIGSDSFIAQKFLSTSFSGVKKGISRIYTQNSIEVCVEDFSNIADTDFKGNDVILNFAAIVHRPDINDSSIYNRVNHEIAIINAQKAKQAGVNLFIQMSTIAVYGNNSNISVTSPHLPHNPYGSSKLKADEELLAMQDEHFKVAIVRPPMVYGGGKAPGNMMRLIKLADKGIPLPFKGIDNKRDFINVHNLVQYLSIIAEKQLSGIHLIADQEPVSTEYLLKCINKYLGKSNRLIKVPGFGLNMLKKFRPNEYDKLFGTLCVTTNFQYEDLIKRHSVESGIREMVDWYKANKGK